VGVPRGGLSGTIRLLANRLSRHPLRGVITLTAHARAFTLPLVVGDADMTTNVVNMDAMIPREDFYVTSAAPNLTSITRISVNDLASGFLVPTLRKPDFQRETKDWSPAKVADLVRTFLDGELIPAIILWQAGGNVFVIDGAHRLSALLAWVRDDYGDGTFSKKLFDIHIPDEQARVADRTRKQIHSSLRSYSDYQVASGKPGSITDQLFAARVQRLAINALDVQWVRAETALAAENSFFKINDSATPLDKTERLIIKARQSPVAIASRAVTNSGTGHIYWSKFDSETQNGIATMSAEIHSALFDPPLSEPIKTLDIPVAGHGYNILTLIFNIVCNANGIPFADLKAAAKDAKVVQKDNDGKETITLLRNVRDLLELVTGTSAKTIGPHPAVYFYTRSGAFQPAALLATADLLAELQREKKLTEFTRIREWFEGFITENKEFISVIVHKHGSGARSVAPIYEFFKWLANQMMEAKSHLPIFGSFWTKASLHI
jgi:hypothetical protein